MMVALTSVKCRSIVHRMIGESIHKYKEEHLWEERKIMENNFR